MSVAQCPQEPRYQSRTLSQWILLFYEASGPYAKGEEPTDAERKAAEKAISVIGTNGIPTSIRWLSKDYDTRDYFHFVDFFQGYTLNGAAWDFFDILGEKAQSAAPGLSQLAQNGKDAEVRKSALECLLKVVPDKRTLVPVFIKCTKDKDAKVRLYALGGLTGEIGLEKEAAQAIAKTLIDDPDRYVRQMASDYLAFSANHQ